MYNRNMGPKEEGTTPLAAACPFDCLRSSSASVSRRIPAERAMEAAVDALSPAHTRLGLMCRV